MAINFQYQSAPFGSYTTLNVTTSRIAQLRIHFTDGSPAVATWIMYAANHTTPVPIGAFVRIWDDAGSDPDGAAFSATNPLFEGHVVAPSPSDDANVVQYTAYDPTHLAQQTCNVMSLPWVQGNVITGARPTPAAAAYPRLVVNATVQNDDDWTFQRAEGQNLGGIIGGLLVDQYHPLYWANAAPGDGSSAGNGTAHVSGDLTGMTFVPQEKVVFETETIRAAVEKMLSMEPTKRLLFYPGTRKWRVYDLTTATEVTLTLNDFDGDNRVLSFGLQRSMQDRYTAVKFYGPEVVVPAIASTVDGSLTIDPTSGITLETVGSTPIKSYTRFQVTNSTKRRMSRMLPGEIYVGTGGYNHVPSRSPSFQISYDGGSTWGGAIGPYYDSWNGIVYLPLPQYYHTSEGRTTPTGVQHYFTPTQYRLVYAYLDAPISTRYPASGYDGTAYSVGGLQNELHVYDDMISVGYNWFGTAVTTTERLTEFNKLAQKMHEDRKDIVYTGGCTLDGMRYEFCRLNRRVNFAAVDGNGSTITTGWESAKAWLTDVEYDFENDLTTLQFSSDRLQMIGMDPDDIKKRLKIRALKLVRTWKVWSYPLYEGTRQTTLGGAVLASGWYVGAQAIDIFVDVKTGQEART